MPTKPNIQHLNATSVDILNTIRANASPQYQSTIPQATADTSSIRAIGTIMMQYQPLQNEFLTNLVNRIGRVILTSKLYENPWAGFKKGLLEYGETVEEIFVNIAKPFQYDPETSEETVWRREIPDVRAAFHTMNYRKFYKATVSNDELRTAFLSWSGITDLIAKIVDSMYTAANYDEFQTMKYLVAKAILNGYVGSVVVDTVNANNMKSITSTIKGTSNLMEFMSSARNLAGVMTYTNKNDQFIILNAKFQAQMDVEVLAAAFNMDKAQFMGHVVLVDSFGAIDLNRLAVLFKDDPNYTPFTTEQLTALDSIPAMIVSREWFMVFDNFYNFTELYNGEGLYWNYWYHVWKTFSISPFAEAQLFVQEAGSITSVSLTPATATVQPGSKLQLKANVNSNGFVSKAVTWSATGGVTVDSNGLATIPQSVTTGENMTVTATSVADPSKSATASLTMGSN